MSANILLSISAFMIVLGSFVLASFKAFAFKNLGFSFLGFGFVVLPVAIWLEFGL
jgi:hypothetical protein